jgi:hypothetical protein
MSAGTQRPGEEEAEVDESEANAGVQETGQSLMTRLCQLVLTSVESTTRSVLYMKGSSDFTGTPR